MRGIVSALAQAAMVLKSTELEYGTLTSLDARLPVLEQNSRRVYLVRHGETQSCRVQGQLDGELTEQGHEQAKSVADDLRGVPVSLVASSALQRSEDTADAIHTQFPKAVRVISPKLREMSFGEEFEGVDLKDPTVSARFKAHTSMMKADPSMPWPVNGESINQVAQRAQRAVMQILDDFPAHSHVCIVGHGRLNRILLEALCSSSLDPKDLGKQKPTCVNVLDINEEGQWTVHLVNHCQEKYCGLSSAWA